MEETFAADIRIVTDTQEEYPDRLLKLRGMPQKLYIRGQFPKEDLPTVAIIGARICTPYGKTQAARYARCLSEQGVQVISGLARGIDGEAHKGALQGAVPTYGVSGCGLDICYPAEHGGLYRKIIERGGIISEQPPGMPPKSWHFPTRNRIISGLADALLVIEAGANSGTFITVDFALEQGKPVYALPGPVDSRLSQGCHRLIAEGAAIAYSPEILLREWNAKTKAAANRQKKKQNGLARTEDMVYSCLDLQPKNLNFLAANLQLSAEEVLIALCELQMQGLAAEIGKNYYIRNQ